jgi:hypothetical protein
MKSISDRLSETLSMVKECHLLITQIVTMPADLAREIVKYESEINAAVQRMSIALMEQRNQAAFKTPHRDV